MKKITKQTRGAVKDLPGSARQRIRSPRPARPTWREDPHEWQKPFGRDKRFERCPHCGCKRSVRTFVAGDVEVKYQPVGAKGLKSSRPDCQGQLLQ